VTLTQEVLRRQVAQRIRVARPDLTDLSPATLDSVRREAAEPAEDSTAVVCVLRRLDLAAMVAGTCALAAGLAEDRVADWRRSFTRTIFLAGNPDNLRDRFAFRYADPDGAIAWTEPATLREHASLRRLLRLFDCSGVLPTSLSVRVPGSATRPVEHTLYVASTGITAGECLVHLGHLLSEAVFDGLLAGGDRLVGLPGPFDALRVAGDPDDPDRLRAYAALVRSRP
jgi:hypothetical protein